MQGTSPSKSRLALQFCDLWNERQCTQTSPTGPAGIEYDNVDAIDGKRPMMLNEIPNISIMVKLRRNSCL